MSGTANEFDNPGGNYPDRRDEDGIGASDPRARSDAGQGGALVQGDGPVVEPAQTEPAMDVDAASQTQQLAGIVAQTRADLGPQTRAEAKAQLKGEREGPAVERAEQVIRQRLDDAGIEISDDRVRALAEEVIGG